MPRPTKLTTAVAKRIALAVKGCASFKAAAELAGVSERSLHAWRARGRAERLRLELAAEKLDALPKRGRSEKARKARARAQRAAHPKKSELRFLEFTELVDQADAEAQVRAAAQIAAAGAENWKAAAWLLERRDPEHFGPPRARVAVEGSSTGTPVAVSAVHEIEIDHSDPRVSEAAHTFLAAVAGREAPPPFRQQSGLAADGAGDDAD